MKRTILVLALFASVLAPTASAQAAEFGLTGLDLSFRDQSGATFMQAGSHPFEMSTVTSVATEEGTEAGFPVPVEEVKDVEVSLPPGVVGDPAAVPRCLAVDFLANPVACPDATAVGVVEVEYGLRGSVKRETLALFNLEPAPGTVAKVGFVVERSFVPVVVSLVLNPDPPYNLVARTTDISQGALFFSAEVIVWGVPADSAHDSERGFCAGFVPPQECTTNLSPQPFLTMPTACRGPLATTWRADSWQNPMVPYPFVETVLTHDDSIPPVPLGLSGCSKLGFTPSIEAKPTSKAGSSPTGLDFSLDVDDEGLTSPTGYAASTIEKAVVTLPEGMSANPSLAEGLNVCTEAQLAKETAFSEAGAGCPNASKIGTVEVETPLLEETVNGSLFIAEPSA